MVDQFTNDIKLVITGKHQRFFADVLQSFFGNNRFLINLQVEKACQDIQQALFREDFVPQIGGAVVAGNGWVTFAVLVPAIEGKKESVFAI